MNYVNNKPPLVVLTGPTAVGKTDISIQLAKKLNSEIISADSIQVYKYMDIGSAKITPAEMQGVRHYLIDELDPAEEFNIFKFQELTKKYIDEIYSHNKVPMIVGGTGFYIQSVLYDVDFNETHEDNTYRKHLEDIAAEKGNLFLHNILKEIDPVSAQKIHYNNVKRVIRAIEFYHETGQKLSEHNEEQHQNEAAYNFMYFVLNDKRDILYDRINKRVDVMFENGLVDEVKRLLDKGYSRELVSMQGIGYKETISYILGEIPLQDTIELIKKETRHFAKRQLTWFRREKEVSWVNVDSYNYDKARILDDMVNKCVEKRITNEFK